MSTCCGRSLISKTAARCRITGHKGPTADIEQVYIAEKRFILL
jgi:hypothetical protein